LAEPRRTSCINACSHECVHTLIKAQADQRQDGLTEGLGRELCIASERPSFTWHSERAPHPHMASRARVPLSHGTGAEKLNCLGKRLLEDMKFSVYSNPQPLVYSRAHAPAPRTRHPPTHIRTCASIHAHTRTQTHICFSCLGSLPRQCGLSECESVCERA